MLWLDRVVAFVCALLDIRVECEVTWMLLLDHHRFRVMSAELRASERLSVVCHSMIEWPTDEKFELIIAELFYAR